MSERSTSCRRRTSSIRWDIGSTATCGRSTRRSSRCSMRAGSSRNAPLYRDLVSAGAVDLQLPTHDELRRIIDPALDRHASDDDGLLDRRQSELRDALESGAALEWDVVPPVHPETRNLLSTFGRERREN